MFCFCSQHQCPVLDHQRSVTGDGLLGPQCLLLQQCLSLQFSLRQEQVEPGECGDGICGDLCSASPVALCRSPQVAELGEVAKDTVGSLFRCPRRAHLVVWSLLQ